MKKRFSMTAGAFGVFLAAFAMTGCHHGSHHDSEPPFPDPAMGLGADGNVLTGDPVTVYTFYATDVTAKYGRITPVSEEPPAAPAGAQEADALPAPVAWHYVLPAEVFQDRSLKFPLKEEFTLKNGSKTVTETVLIGEPGGNAAGIDPLVPFQWHIYNNGEEKFDLPQAPLAGIDLRVIEAWHLLTAGNVKVPGSGVHVALFDSQVDFQHEDLASRKYENAAFPDPGNIRNQSGPDLEKLKDDCEDIHGTAVAGLIAADGSNGAGGAGIAFGASITSYLLDEDAIMGDKSFRKGVQGYYGDDDEFPVYSDDDDDDDDDDKDIDPDLDGFSFVDQDPEVTYRIKQGIDANMAEMFRESGDRKDTDLINMSLGFDYLTYNSPATWSLLDGLRDKGISLFKAMGNEYDDTESNIIEEEYDKYTGLERQFNMNSPVERHPYVITVGAVNARGFKSSYSSCSAGLWIAGLGGEEGYTGSVTDSAALVTTLSSYDPRLYDDLDEGTPFRNMPGTAYYTAKMNGTSAATPTIAGVGALVVSAKPDITVPQMRYVLARSARNDEVLPALTVPTQDTYIAEIAENASFGWQTNSAGMRHSSFYGFGLADAAGAVKLAFGCADDEGCLKRAALPEQYTAAEVSCSYEDPETRKAVICSVSGLKDSAGSPLTNELEVDALTVNLAGYGFALEGQTAPACVGLNEEESSREFRKGVVNANNVTQISLTHSGTQVKSMLKPYYAAWDYYGANAWEDVASEDNPLEIPAADFYLEKVSGDTVFTVTIRSQCRLKAEDLNRSARVTVYGY